MEHNAEHRLSRQFEYLVADLSEMLVALPAAGQSDEKIIQGLERLVEWMKIDRASLFQLWEDQTVITQVHTPNTNVGAESFRAEEITWLTEMTRCSGGMDCQRLDDLPADADRQRAFAQRHGMAAYVAILLKSGSLLLGMLLLETCRPDYTWSDELTRRLGIIGNIFTGVLLGKYTEDTLRDSHDHVVATLKAIPDFMLEVDQSGLIYDYHLPVYEPFPLTAEVLVGQKVDAVFSPAVAEVLTMALNEAAHQVHYRSAPYMLETPEGQHWYELSAAVKGISEVKDKHFVVFIRDITERVRTEEVLRERDRLQAALETEKELHRIKNNLMRTITHEFRVPLSVIGLSQALLNDYYDKLTLQQRAKQLNVIRGQVNKLEQMVAEIVAAVSDVFSGLKFEPSVTDLDLLCQLSVSEVQATIGARHQLIFENRDCPHDAWIDQRLVNRILINLLSNAIKYSPEGSVIRLEVFEQASDIVLQISDQGIGISDDDQKRLFEPFFRAGNVGSTSGLGLGLSIVRDCVALHQGTVTVNSQLNHGTTFIVCLPIKSLD